MFKRLILCGTAAAAVLLPVQALHAQNDTDDDGVVMEEVVVQGVRASITQALNIKRESTQIVDGIVAEDIGKFPDNNLAEALQRVTGVQVTDRGGGEVSAVSIRGLTDVFTTVNGRKVFTSSGRAVAVQDIPASLLRTVNVYKTRSADLLPAGIAGLVDVRTHRPFDFDGTRFSGVARLSQQEYAGETDPDLSFLASSRWNTGVGEFGALFNVSYREATFRDQSVTAGAQLPFVTENSNPTTPQGPFERIFADHDLVAESPIWEAGQLNGLPDAPGSTLTINGEEQEYYLARDAVFQNQLNGERERPAASLSLQFAPNDSSEYLFEVFYNGYHQTTHNSLFFTFADWWIPPPDDFELYPGTNIVAERTVAAPYGFNSGDYTKGETDSWLYALGGEWDIGDRMTVKSELIFQDSQYEEEFFAMRIDRVANELFVDFNRGDGTPAFEFIDDPATPVDEGNAQVLDPAAWNMAQLYDNGDRDEGEATTFKVDADYDTDWGIIRTVEFGLRADDRSAEEFNRSTANEAGPVIAPEEQAELLPSLLMTTTDFFDGDTDTPSSWVVPGGPDTLTDNRELLRTEVYDLDPENLILEHQFSVDETRNELYLSADYETEVGGGHLLDGQFGVRHVNVERDMVFTDQVDGEVGTATADDTETVFNFLVRYGITDNLDLRFAYGETFGPPAFNQLNAIIDFVPDVTDIGYGTGTGGNPNLAPATSQNYDLSLEWYFDEDSALYGTLFKREIEGLIVPFRNIVRVDLPDDSPDRGVYPFVVDQPENASDGELDGYELGLVWFPDSLGGFGVQASYTGLDSSQTIPQTDSSGEVTGMLNTPIFGVSDSSYSVVLAYENFGFEGRLAYVWREAFQQRNEAAQFANPLRVWRSDEERLDLQLSYYFTDDLVLTFDAQNLTDDITREYYGNQPTVHNFSNTLFGRTYALSARFGF